MEKESQPKIPHQAVVEINVEIMPVLPDGRMSGKPVKKFSKLKTFTGTHLDDCVQQVERYIDGER